VFGIQLKIPAIQYSNMPILHWRYAQGNAGILRLHLTDFACSLESNQLKRTGWEYHMPKAPSPQRIKDCVREMYAKLAAHGSANIGSAPIPCGEELARALGYDTASLRIPRKAWRLFAGCGNPLEEVRLEQHWTVLDLGCGVGIDSQIAALALKPSGRVIGLDITRELLCHAKEYSGSHPMCHWVAGDGEELPLRSGSIDLVMANGVFNLMPHKEQALAEINRVLKPGGYLSLADLIVVGEMEVLVEGFEEAWSWCVAGALTSAEYDLLMQSAGFSWWELKEKGSYGPLAAGHILAQKSRMEESFSRANSFDQSTG
jgi:arsenite methyltransferase